MKTNTCELCEGTGIYKSRFSDESDSCGECQGTGLIKFLECCKEMKECLHIQFRIKGEDDDGEVPIEPGFYIIDYERDYPMYSPLHYCPWCGAKI